MYAELRCKTNFSFLYGASHPEELIHRAADIGLMGIAITDINGVYGAPKAYWKAKEFPQLKLIVGVDLKMTEHPPITLLARDRKAYGRMCRIITRAHAGKEKGMATLHLAELIQEMNDDSAKNLICIPDPGSNYEVLKELFENRLYLPISRFKDGFDKKRTEKALEISKLFEIPMVATNDVLYHAKERKPLQDSFTAIKEGISLPKAGFKLKANGERYLKSPFEMKLLFKDLPDAVQNTLVVSESCTFSMKELKYRYPSEWIPSPHTAQSYLEELTLKGAKERYKGLVPDDVLKQLYYEFNLIKQMEFADYFLTIFDIVDFAKKRKILCQGRGSAANSAVCYCLGITAIDPVRMKLLFERFISIERKEPPDIDVDFEHERREEVIQYIYEKYGRDRAAMVSAVITYQKRSAIREISKAFGVEVGTLSAKKLLKDFDQYAKTSPVENCKDYIDQLADEMTAFPRHISIHSGGFTLSADPIIEIVPVEPARMEGRTIIQWDKYDLDYLGLLKIDVLALGMLSALRKSLDLVDMKLHEIPAEDKATYQMIQKADTVGTFQVESRAQMNMSGRLMPRTFYDLVVQVAIVRPGPIVGKMVHPYLKRRNGEEKVEYPHPKLRDILGKTLGIPLFQEQLMKIAIELGDFSPGEADYLRRAIGAWRASGSIQKVAERLLAGLKAKGIPDSYAEVILEHMKGFAHYGFPESHAASFALLTYASCYLKKHHPAEFACGLINSWPMGFYHPHSIIDDAKRHGVAVLPVDPNRSDWDSTMEGKCLRLGLRVVHGLAKKDADVIVSNRPYKNMADFLAKTNVRSDVLHRLAMGDAFSTFGMNQRHTLWQILGDQVKTIESQLDMFSGFENQKNQNLFKDLSEFQEIKSDYEAFGMSARGHPMSALRKIHALPKLTIFDAKRTPPKKYIKTSGLLLVRQKPPTANGVCFAAIEDEHGFLDLVLFSKEFEKFKEVFLYQCFLIVGGYIEREGHSISMIVKSVEPIWKNQSEELNGLTIEPTQYFW
jgi:error-prone DNA polymerase